MISNKLISNLRKDVKQQIAEGTIELICKNGIEQLSIKQVAVKCGVNISAIIGYYHSLSSLVVFGVQLSVSELAAYLTCKKCKSSYTSRGIEEFWKVLVVFHQDHAYKARLICSYLKNPVLFPTTNVKCSLMESISKGFDATDHQLKNSSTSIRFIAFIHLFQMAGKASIKIQSSIDAHDRKLLTNYFHSNVEIELNNLLALPIC